jgi:hypothetical protein
LLFKQVIGDGAAFLKMDKQLFVLFTMDVEPSSANPGISGPDSDETGMKSIRDFQAVLDSAGLCFAFC